jgi:hypothetical protein
MATQSNEVQIQIGDEVKILEGDELIAFNNMRAEIEAEAKALRDAAEAEAEAKATARQALLTRLGITAEEAQLLLGGN